MMYVEVKKDLFEVNSNLRRGEKPYVLAHCISSDFAMAGGIVLEFNKRYNAKKKVIEIYGGIGKEKFIEEGGYNIPIEAYTEDGIEFMVGNLVTKELVSDKPTYENLKRALECLRCDMGFNGFTKLAIPQIGCGIDGLEWERVKEIILEVFSGTGYEIIVCIWR